MVDKFFLQISVLSAVRQLMEFLKVVLVKFLTMELILLSIPFLQKNLAYLIDLLQVESVRSTVQPMGLVDARSTGPSRPIDSEASASFEQDPSVVVVLLIALSSLD
jgi:hypothetical protein